MHLRNILNTNFDSILECNDVNIAVSILDKKLNDNHDQFFPLKSVKKHPKSIYKPSQESLNAIKAKKKLHKKFKVALKKVTKSKCNKCNVCANCINLDKAWENYKVQRNMTNKITKTNKRENLVNDLKAKSAKNDLRRIWKSIKLAANLPTKSNPKVKSMIV